jgi:hypothetical protein
MNHIKKAKEDTTPRDGVYFSFSSGKPHTKAR